MIRIAGGSGYWGDFPQAPALQVRSGPIEYLVLDYLAEVTLSILSRQKAMDPSTGYATDFVEDIGELLPEIVAKGIKVIANAGGANPNACASALMEKAKSVGVDSLVVGIVKGGDLTERLTPNRADSLTIEALEEGWPAYASVAPRIVAAYAYMKMNPIVEALAKGAQVVITGRVSDPGLFLAPIVHEFGIGEEDWDSLAFGTVIGHILECGGQASGGNFLGDWRSVPELERIGFPIAEVFSKDRAVITKHESLGGLVSQATIKEQLVYEIGDPKRYLTPDCAADFTTLRLRDDGPNRVEVTGARGGPAPEKLKAACYYEDGWRVSGQVTYPWPEAGEKARAAGELVRKRSEAKMGPLYNSWRIEVLGVDACHGSLGGERVDPPEATLRVTATSESREACDWVGREIVALVLSGPPGATGFAAGRPRASRVYAYWPGLVARAEVRPEVEILTL